MSEAKIKAPDGYRIAKIGEIRPGGYLALKCGEWQRGSLVGWVVEDSHVPVAFPVKKPKPASKPTPAKWVPIPADTKLTKVKVIEMANKLGAENAKLKNKLAKGVG